MIGVKYSDILKLNKELEDNFRSIPYGITILSNIIVNQSKEILEYLLRCEDIIDN